MMFHAVVAASILAVSAAGARQDAIDHAATGDSEYIRCVGITHPRQDVRLAFGISGRVESLEVGRGDRVVAGQVLARLDGDDVEANVKLLQVRALGTWAIEGAEASWRAADDTLRRTAAAHGEGGATDRELFDARQRAEQLKASLNVERQKQIEASWELAAAKARFERTIMRATFDGVIEDVHLEPGSAVDELAAVLRLVDDSVFRVDVAVPTERTFGLAPGTTITVAHRGDAARGAPTKAIVLSLASVADAASGTRMVRLELANPTGLPAGLPIDVFVPAKDEALAAASDR
jgi:RND family efflux transporter MFP subunit